MRRGPSVGSRPVCVQEVKRMHRGWWIKVGTVSILAILSAMALVPTLATPAKGSGEEAPSWLANFEKVWNRRLNLGLDLQGGLLLQYKVEVDKAVRDKVDRTEEDLVKRLKNKKPDLQVESRREGLSTIYLKFANEADTAIFDEDMQAFFSEMLIDDLGDGELKVAMDPQYMEETQEYAMEQAIGTIRERIDALGVAEPDIKKSGKSDIVVQLPGLGEEDFERAKRLIGTTA